MTPRSRDSSIIHHILSYCTDIEKAQARFGNNFDNFAKDKDYQYVCTICLLQIGELCNKLSPEFRHNHIEMPWRQIINMRNLVAHAYGSISIKTT